MFLLPIFVGKLACYEGPENLQQIGAKWDIKNFHTFVLQFFDNDLWLVGMKRLSVDFSNPDNLYIWLVQSFQ